MTERGKQIIYIFALLFLVGVVIRDSLFHFQKERIVEKRQHRSPIRHWSLFYSPKFVLEDSPIRYGSDFKSISGLVEPGYLLISDKATSYYAAAFLPLFIRNVHSHHASGGERPFVDKLQRGHFCYMQDPYHREEVVKYLEWERSNSTSQKTPEVRYFLLNKDRVNSQLRWDCMSVGRSGLIDSLGSISKLLYSGDYLNLYQFKSFERENGSQ